MWQAEILAISPRVVLDNLFQIEWLGHELLNESASGEVGMLPSEPKKSIFDHWKQVHFPQHKAVCLKVQCPYEDMAG